MTRLTKQTKEIILNRAIKDIFSERDDQDKRTQSEIFKEIVDHRVGVDQVRADNLYRELKAKAAEFNKLLGLGEDEGIFKATSHIFRGSWLSASKTWRQKADVYNYLNDEGEFVLNDQGGPTTIQVDRYGQAESDLHPDNVTEAQRKKLEAFWLSREKLEEDKERLKTKIKACLESVTTVKKLVETYPDLEKYVPSSAKGTGVVLAVPPMELIAEMNKAREGGKPRSRARKSKSAK